MWDWLSKHRTELIVGLIPAAAIGLVAFFYAEHLALERQAVDNKLEAVDNKLTETRNMIPDAVEDRLTAKLQEVHETRNLLLSSIKDATVEVVTARQDALAASKAARTAEEASQQARISAVDASATASADAKGALDNAQRAEQTARGAVELVEAALKQAGEAKQLATRASKSAEAIEKFVAALGSKSSDELSLDAIAETLAPVVIEQIGARLSNMENRLNEMDEHVAALKANVIESQIRSARSLQSTLALLAEVNDMVHRFHPSERTVQTYRQVLELTEDLRQQIERWNVRASETQ